MRNNRRGLKWSTEVKEKMSKFKKRKVPKGRDSSPRERGGSPRRVGTHPDASGFGLGMGLRKGLAGVPPRSGVRQKARCRRVGMRPKNHPYFYWELSYVLGCGALEIKEEILVLKS